MKDIYEIRCTVWYKKCKNDISNL